MDTTSGNNLNAALAYLNSVMQDHISAEKDWPFDKIPFTNYGIIGNLQKSVEYIQQVIDKLKQS